jgi:glycolate oxidase iron-sulfur subunit
MNKLDNFTHCVKCGTCKTVCPVFIATGKESHVARGKIALLEVLLDSEEKFSDKTYEILSSCVVCGSCQFVCPRDVQYIDIIEMAREKAVKEGKIPLMKKVMLTGLTKNKLLKTASALSEVLPESSGLYYKLPLINKYFPKFQKQLDTKIRNYNFGEKSKIFDILFFPGCGTRYIFSDTGKKLVSVLNKLGIGVYFEKDFKCCGFPHLTAGEKQLFEKLKAHNLQLFDSYKGKVKYIVSGCATCGSALVNNYNLPVPYKDINQIIFENIDNLTLKKLNTNTYYHHPCHLLKHQNVKEEPVNLLKQVSNLKKMEGDDVCCGFGGSFSIFQSKLSNDIGDNKGKMIKQTVEKSQEKEKVVVTSCPGCIIQLTDTVYRNHIDVKVMHIIDILYKGLED